MAARRRAKQATDVTKRNPKSGDAVEQPGKTTDSSSSAKNAVVDLAEEHLAPLPFVCIVLLCSGVLWVLAFRDVFATGRVIAGHFDEAMLLFTKSNVFFDDSKGWKSSQGGLSSIAGYTTDANNMGGLFVRKLGGVAVLAAQTQKLLPLLFHPAGAQWNKGHFRPLYLTAFVGNMATLVFYASYMEDLSAAGADGMALLVCGLLALESMAIVFFSLLRKYKASKIAISLPEGKTPSSVTSRIVTKTVTLVSGFLAVIFVRDLFFPGQIMGMIPRDDIYLEWTGAFFHSPPRDSHEDVEQGLEAPLHVGDKFVSQLLALHVLIGCMYKFASAFFIRYGADGSGVIKCRMIWKAQAIGDGLILMIFRLFTMAAQTASLDLRWHLVCIAYEAFVLVMYGIM